MKNIVIVGGGTAGWMAAAALSRVLGKGRHNLTLIESDDIGTVGVGEATIPMIDFFHKVLGVTPVDILRETEATFKLGIEFVDWRKPGHRYFHPFGNYGTDMGGIGFRQHWLRMARLTDQWDHRLWDHGLYNLETIAARAERFSLIQPKDPGQPRLNHAYHFDASLYAQFLSRYGQARGVTRIEGLIERVEQNPDTGDVECLHLRGGESVSGDLFLDCSGFRGLLIEQTLKAGYEDWSHWLPCNRAFAVPSARVAPPLPYTRATAREAGWQWRIPLQHRTGNGYVFCDGFIAEDDARERLLSRLDGEPLAEPRLLKFTTGHRRKMWDKNVIALGLSSGFLEPLESTSIHLAQSALTRLITLLPAGEIAPRIRDTFNGLMRTEYEHVRDFIIAHYKITERDDTPFWKHCRNMPIPDSLRARLDLFSEHGVFIEDTHDLFKDANWFSVLAGQGMYPNAVHPIAESFDPRDTGARLAQIQDVIARRADALPPHQEFIDSCLGKGRPI